MKTKTRLVIVAFICGTIASSAHAWDHGGHMTIAAIAYSKIKRERPELIEKISAILMAHPDKAPFAVAAGKSKGSSSPG